MSQSEVASSEFEVEKPQPVFPHPEGFPQLLLTMNPRTLKMEVSGQVDDLLLCLDLLETAKNLIMKLHRDARKTNIIAAPASVLEQLKNGK